MRALQQWKQDTFDLLSTIIDAVEAEERREAHRLCQQNRRENETADQTAQRRQLDQLSHQHQRENDIRDSPN